MIPDDENGVDRVDVNCDIGEGNGTWQMPGRSLFAPETVVGWTTRIDLTRSTGT